MRYAPSPRAIGTMGSASCTFICVQGCQTAPRERASQSSLTRSSQSAKVEVEAALAVRRDAPCDVERPQPRVGREEEAARAVEVARRDGAAVGPGVARLER